MSTEAAVYSDPSAVTCPRCDRPAEKPCVNDDGSPRERWHLARERRPMLYECRHCGGPCSVSFATGMLVHVGKVDATHSAQIHEDGRRWR